MSSWIRAKSSSLSGNTSIKKEITSYHDTSLSKSLIEIYLEFIAAAIYTKKLNETCTVWDPSGILGISLKSNPLVSILKEKPSVGPKSIELYKATLSTMKFNDIQRYISNVFEYNNKFNSLLDRLLEALSVRREIDLCVHLTNSIPLDSYIEIIQNYKKTFENKSRLTIYIIADSDLLERFKILSDSTWNLVSLPKDESADDTDQFIRTMAEIKLLSTTSSMILDFSKPLDRLIYLLRKPRQELQYFREINNLEWFLL